MTTNASGKGYKRQDNVAMTPIYISIKSKEPSNDCLLDINFSQNMARNMPKASTENTASKYYLANKTHINKLHTNHQSEFTLVMLLYFSKMKKDGVYIIGASI